MDNETPLPPQEPKPKCGIIMPISAMDGYLPEHWKDVLAILQDAIDKAGFDGDLVSVADEVNIIQKTIVQNLYNSQVVVCDISGRNANVMFELGIRLTFDKPTVIVCDDNTQLPFDTGMIEHVIYPKTLRYQQVEDLKIKLIRKIKATNQAALESEGYSSFLKHFGEFVVPKLNQKEIPENQFIINSLNELKEQIKSIRNSINKSNVFPRPMVSFPRTGYSPPEGTTLDFYYQNTKNFLYSLGFTIDNMYMESRIKNLVKQFLMTLPTNYEFDDEIKKESFIETSIERVLSERSLK